MNTIDSLVTAFVSATKTELPAFYKRAVIFQNHFAQPSPLRLATQANGQNKFYCCNAR
jgi:hypothetical protein